ncbi:bacterial group 2 Ig-like protein [Tannerella forsythia 92A2]|uniref:Bacterial group 2 Ig-like protein n=1 Tax=Tannerella forsythia (strain ATCC 43037 / JCM 10827 / CCUG 21028 A / KCTC 5666 / FDC 338) TaxID=203275 RepID=G8UNQ8_TANFA|nr:bacterial group 2 Ig-like protein [Tannerella forsythia 92A2]
MKTRHHYPILLIALLLGLMGFAEHAQADYTLGHYTRVEADNNTIKLAWTKTTGSQGTMSLQFRYRVRWRESGYSTWKEKTTTDLNFTINGSYNTMYEVEVISEAIYGTGGGSYGVRKVNTIADPELPGELTITPKELTMEAKANGKIVIIRCNKPFKFKGLDAPRWLTYSGGVTGYKDRLRLLVLALANTGPERSATITFKTTAGNVTLKVTQKGETPAADTETPKPGHFVLGYPKAISPTAIEVKWTPAKDNVTAQEKLRYRVKCIRHSDGKEVKTSPELTNQTEYTITGIEPETEYRIQITVWDEANNSDGYGDPIVKTPPAADTEKPKPGGYVDGYPKAISPTEIVVKWNKATDNVTKQEKLRYQVRCGLFKKLVKSSPILTDETEYTITDLPYSDMTYDISVKVWDEADNVTFYSVKEVKPLEKEPKPTVQVSSVMLDQPKVTIDGDRESFRLEATVLPANATNPALQWSSSNESVATVEAVSLSSMLKSGTVEGSAVTVRIHKKGKAEITAQAMDGSGKTASCQVEVISTVGNETIDGLRVYAVDGALHLTLLAPQIVHLYDVSGALVRTMDAPAGDHVLPLAPGVYLVRIGEQIAKVLIK